jgi:hypothetical protein
VAIRVFFLLFIDFARTGLPPQCARYSYLVLIFGAVAQPQPLLHEFLRRLRRNRTTKKASAPRITAATES